MDRGRQERRREREPLSERGECSCIKKLDFRVREIGAGIKLWYSSERNWNLIIFVSGEIWLCKQMKDINITDKKWNNGKERSKCYTSVVGKLISPDTGLAQTMTTRQNPSFQTNRQIDRRTFKNKPCFRPPPLLGLLLCCFNREN